MALHSQLCSLVLDWLSGSIKVRARAMFGGYGIYVCGLPAAATKAQEKASPSRHAKPLGDLMFALIAGEVLYIKVDEQTQPYFEKAGSQPFVFHPPDREPIRMSYWQAPEGALETPESLEAWALLGVAAAKRASTKRSAASAKSPGTSRKKAKAKVHPRSKETTQNNKVKRESGKKKAKTPRSKKSSRSKVLAKKSGPSKPSKS